MVEEVACNVRVFQCFVLWCFCCGVGVPIRYDVSEICSAASTYLGTKSM